MSPQAKKLEIEEEHTCPECNSEHLVRDYARGELVCGACGLVVNESAIDGGPEWAAYSVEENDRLARTGAPKSYSTQNIGLTTVIPLSNRDAHGNRIAMKEREKYYRMSKLQRHSSHSRPGERSLPETIRVLDRVAATMGLPRSKREEVGFICKRALEKGLLRGRSIEALVAAAIYAACRLGSVPRTLEEVAQATGVRKKQIAKVYGSLLRELHLKVPPAHPADYVNRFCSMLELSPKVQAEALKIIQQIDEVDSSLSLSPIGTTAAAIYLASLKAGERRPQKAIARVAGVSEVTLRNRFQYVSDAFMHSVALPRGRAPKAS